jgi:hypothetical protein
MAGPFDNFFGGGGAAAGNMFGGNMYGDLLTPEQLAAVRRQSMMQVAAKLLESSGPSTTRRTLGQTLGGALSAGAEAMQSGQTNAVQQMLLRQKLEEAKLQKDQAARIAEIFGAGQPAPTPLTGVDAINAPANGAVGPTMSRAAAIGTMPVGPSKADLAARYRQAANVSASDPAKAKAYMDIANQLAPQEKFSTTPQFGRSAAGTPISYVLSESGDMKVLDVQQNPDFSYQDMGGYISVRDKRNNKEVEQIKKTMSASEIASNRVALGNLGVAQSNLSLARERFKREGFDVVDTEQGKMYVPKVPGQAAIPVLGPDGLPIKSSTSAKPPTEGQLGASGFANRMEASETIFSRIPADQVPRFGMSGQSSILSYFRSPEGQMAKQAADDWIRAKLREESGAVIGEDEMMAEYKTYFPMPGDSAQVVAQKAQARQRATDAMKRNAGPAYVPYTPPPAAAPIPGLGTGTIDLGNYFTPPRR